MRQLIMLSGVCAALTSFTASAIDPANVWVNPITSGPGPVKVHDSDQPQAIAKSLIKPWLQQQASGERLSEWQVDEHALHVLHVPMGVERFTQGELTIEGADKLSVFVNGQPVNGNNQQFELSLQTGDHQLLVLVEAADWDALSLNWEGKEEHDRLHTERPDSYRLNAEQLFDAQTTAQLSISPNGDYLIWQRQHFSAETGDSPQTRIQLMDVDNQRTLFEWTDSSAGNFAWHGEEDKLAYISGGVVKTLDLATMEITTLSAQLEGINGLRWLNEDNLLFSWTERDEGDHGLAKRYRALQDRWSYFRDESQLYTLNTDTRAMAQLTQDDLSVSLQDIHPSGDYVVASQYIVDYNEPPHFASRLIEIEVSSGDIREIGEFRTFNRALYADEGLYVVAGPEFAAGAGRNVDDELLSNNYDGQLYWMSREGNDVQALSRDFDPAIGGIHKTSGNDLILSVTERDGTQLYHYRASDSRFQRVEQDLDVVNQVSVSEQSTPRLVFAGTNATRPERVYTQTLGQSANLWWDSASDYYRLNRFDDVEEWNFTNSRGDTIYGRVYLPHDFDDAKQYPALVYYYGGTTPVQRAFTGRYPFNLWADMGYVVYVIQPTGAIGFGQDFSARHVNAWGEYTTDDIIEGVERFIEDHAFVDADRIGNLGASYGGFMTMLLATKTDLFAASMSHAGISHITSYWGQGWWGFLYSGEASKGSFPWNAPELYRERSPVNFADRINTPMLLIHGDADTNVPAGESHNMYTALKLLGRDVELVEYVGEDHAINRRTPRLHWWQTYMAFFDKHLKDEPEWWQSLYAD